MTNLEPLTGAGGDAQAIIDVTREAAEPAEVHAGGTYSVVVPAGGEHVVFDVDHLLDHPRRKQGHPTFFRAASLAEYVNAHKGEGTVVYADANATVPKIEVLLNGHEEDAPGWGDHRASLRLRVTPEWERWMRRNGEIGKQSAFAEHIEDCLADIVEPEGAVMLELAQHFQAATKVNFRSAKQLADGQRQLVYEETIEAKAGQRGEITIPSTFIIGVAPFEGSAGYRVTARLRYRLHDGALAIGYVLDRPDKVVRAAFDDILTEVEDTTGLRPLFGTP